MSYLADFNCKIYGPSEGRKWVFVHGLMGYGQNWRRIVSGLEATEQCLVFDQRGHGRSIKPEHGYAPQDYANDIRHIVDELGWDKFVLVGHSMGGRNVLKFANLYPERLLDLVIEDIGPEAQPEAHKYYEDLLNVVPTPFATREEARQFFMNDFIHKAKTRENVEVMAQYFYANIEEKPEGGVDWRFSKNGIIESVLIGRGKDSWSDVKNLKVRTLLVRGANSPELGRETYREMLASNPLLEGVEIPGAGHWVHSDQAQAFIAALKSFVGGF